MMKPKSLALALTLGLALVPLVRIAQAAAGQGSGNTWSIDFDDPNRDGTITIETTVSYLDDLGKRKTKKVTTKVDIDNELDNVSKKTKVVSALEDAFGDKANQIADGVPLVEVSGGLPSGDTGQLVAGADQPDTYTDLKIKRVKIKDPTTGEDDVIQTPGQNVSFLGEILATGDITGLAPDGAGSVFTVLTSAGGFEVPLNAQMSKIDVVDAIQSALVGQGAKSWADYDRSAVYIVIDESITGIGAGCTDKLLSSSCSVIAR